VTAAATGDRRRSMNDATPTAVDPTGPTSYSTATVRGTRYQSNGTGTRTPCSLWWPKVVYVGRISIGPYRYCSIKIEKIVKTSKITIILLE